MFLASRYLAAPLLLTFCKQTKFSNSFLRSPLLATTFSTMSAETVDKVQKTNLMTDKKGKYIRNPSKYRSEEVTGEAGRYHLHIALACPWACGTLSTLFLKGLEDSISHSVVHPTWQKTREDPEDPHCGWVYRKVGDEPLANSLGHGANPCDDALIPDIATNCSSIRDVYALVGDTTGPYTTPVLFDKKENKIISNESMDILRILNSKFNTVAKNPTLDLYPGGEDEKALLELNDKTIYNSINNGVYRCGFAKTQVAYDEAVVELFGALDEVEERLSKSRFLISNTQFTWLDLRLFHTLVRFDPVYTCYFKTNQKRISDYPNLLGFIRDVYQIPAVKRSINMNHIKTHYYTSHPHLNTFGIIPFSNGAHLNVPSGRGDELSSL